MTRPKHQQGRKDQRARVKDSTVGTSKRLPARVDRVLTQSDTPRSKSHKHRWEQISAATEMCACGAYRHVGSRSVHQPKKRTSRNVKRHVYEAMLKERDDRD